jgi:hypothetical protein
MRNISRKRIARILSVGFSIFVLSLAVAGCVGSVNGQSEGKLYSVDRVISGNIMKKKGDFVLVFGVLKSHDGISYLYPNLELAKFHGSYAIGFRLFLSEAAGIVGHDSDCDGNYVVVGGMLGDLLGGLAIREVDYIEMLNASGGPITCSAWRARSSGAE